MKRLTTAAGILCFFLMAASLNGQTARSETADVIVLMDTSGTVLPYYEVINERVLQSIISKFIRIGDSFHLLSFNAEARYEMSQKIDSEADLSRVVSRFMLLYQLGQSADFLSGINFAQQYMKDIPSQQEKILIVISDGIFNPPESSPYRRYTGEQVKTALAQTAAAIRAEGWKVYYVKLPFPADAVIKDLDGTFYAGRMDSSGSIDRSGADSIENRTASAANTNTGANRTAAAAANTGSAVHNLGTDTAAGDTLRGTDAAGSSNSPAAAVNTGSAAGAANSGNRNTASAANRSNAGSAATSRAEAAGAGQNTQQTAQAASDASAETSRTAAGSLQTGSADQSSGTSALLSEPASAAGSDTDRSGQTANAAADSTGAADMPLTAQSAAGAGEAQTGSVDNGAVGSAGQEPKVYTDVSQAFTENLGIETSDLPEEGSIVFKDTVLLLPTVRFPEQAETSGTQLVLPVTIVNNTAEPTDITVQAVAVEIGGNTYRQELNNLTAHILPQSQSTVTVRLRLPQNMYAQGQHRSMIRLDLAQNTTAFSQAAAVVLTVKPSFISSFLTGNGRWILLAGCCALLVLLFILFMLRRRAQEPVAYAARVVEQQNSLQERRTAPQRETQKVEYPAITATDKRYYPEQQANKTDPRESLNTFSSQTAAAAAETQKETTSHINYLAQEQSRNMEGRFALLNSAENRLSRRPNFSQNYYGRISTKPSQSGMTELFVYNQTTSIGKRNIHVMKPGSRMSIGGSKNDSFFIFLVPFPANLAQIQYTGGEYSLSILKPEYFPYETSTTIHNCIGRDITIVSKKGYHVTFTFRGYEDPMVRLNTILTSINYYEAESSS